MGDAVKDQKSRGSPSKNIKKIRLKVIHRFGGAFWKNKRGSGGEVIHRRDPARRVEWYRGKRKSRCFGQRLGGLRAAWASFLEPRELSTFKWGDGDMEFVTNPFSENIVPIGAG